MNLSLNTEVLSRINRHNPKGNIPYTAKVLLPIMATRPKDSIHSKGVSLDSMRIASRLGLNANKAFYAGLFHDIGKYRQDEGLFDGHDISEEEFRKIKRHAWLGFFYFRAIDIELALIIGSHHAVYENGYGITLERFPHNFGKGKISEILKYAAVVSVADFINAFKHRKTLLKDDPDRLLKMPNLLREKYAHFPQIVEKAIEVEIKNK